MSKYFSGLGKRKYCSLLGRAGAAVPRSETKQKTSDLDDEEKKKNKKKTVVVDGPTSLFSKWKSQ